MLNLFRRGFAALYVVASVAGAIALLTVPGSALAQAANTCKIECERCTCNMNTGICDCTKCVLTGCRF